MEEFNAALGGLFALDFDGPRFTWTNDAVWQRLDYALVNANWMQEYPISKVSIWPEGDPTILHY